ncbi:tyrosine-type recombinase/integrase [Bacillus sp. B-jedd]|uniref:tyrosine-type recombinase/integrase n=1 Tax=Bacillus sp. B-jedd TaxID=1476857 RepID=UPI0005156B64|nr:tyrosine-type recombinase/integrase [Bacillus sp. B-jedd]CEG28122.1 Tyrosine recombinase xerC [Bacillus sp. B-jedd]
MASFIKRGKTWQYTVSAKPKPIRKGGFATKKEAMVAAAEIEANLQKGMVSLRFKKIPFDEYFESWLNLYKPDIGLNTRERYLVTLETIKKDFGGIAIQDITKRYYQAFLNEYGSSRGLATSKKINTHIRACVKEAIDEGLIKTDFTRGVKLTGKAAKRPEEKHMDYLESKRLLKRLYQTIEEGAATIATYLLLLGLTSGMRFAEMVGLTRNDFDFDDNTISITKTWGYTKKMHVGWGPTKNDQSVRKIKMDSRTMRAFKALFDSTPDNITRLVFYSPQSKYRVFSNGGANKALVGILKELKIEPINIHGLRHTHASVLLYKRVSIYYVAERLGHADTTVTQSTYAHIVKELRKEDEQKTVTVFEKMVG